MNLHDFYMGKIFDAYKYFGLHKENDGYIFRVFAPNAERVCITSSFNNWTEQEMTRQTGEYNGVYVFYTQDAKIGDSYKYVIYNGGKRVEHCDPYGFSMELRPGCASVVADMDYDFSDDKWLAERTTNYDKPLNIYELHLGSWKTNPNDPNGFYTYDELAYKLADYLKQNHYTHIEIMPITEHPFDGSWGYQSTGFFSVTSRYGTPKQLKQMIDILHNSGIGVIMDFIPVHFAIDDYGLGMFDGTPLYEYPNDAVGRSEWGSYNFMHSRGDVCSFIQSSANFWLSEYHFDGLRFDAVSRLIYWFGDESRGVNNCTINFIKTMNSGLKASNPTAMLIAEDSTSYNGVTKPIEQGGLGFDYKWDMGWMNDTLNYFKTDPEYRPENYHKLSFSMMYFYNERFILPLSHDENVHGKATIIQKFNGDYEDKFPQARAFYMYMYVHPGKKLNFMGNEIAQFREWDESREQDWDILKYPMHDSFHEYIKKLNEIYCSYDAFFDDYDKNNFLWSDVSSPEDSVYSILRKGKTSQIICIMNFAKQDKKDYKVKIPEGKRARILLNSDKDIYSGSNCNEWYRIEQGSLCLDVKGYSAVMFELY